VAGITLKVLGDALGRNTIPVFEAEDGAHRGVREVERANGRVGDEAEEDVAVGC
jgi:hypothetical protein